jgi:hypothetical protein
VPPAEEKRILDNSGNLLDAKSILQHRDLSALEITTYHSFVWNIIKSHGYLLSPYDIANSAHNWLCVRHTKRFKLAKF